jgi:hypothetical protein
MSYEERSLEDQATDEAAAEAGRIGGDLGDDAPDGAQRPVDEGGGGESEGFELAERDLIEHASHGDQQSAHAILHHQGRDEEPIPGRADGEADREYSSETTDDER